MSRFIWLATRLLWLVVRIVALATSVYVFFIRPWERSWRANPEESAKPLPGDDLVPDPRIAETRAITIDAPPSAIWPWLIQMGFGRAGWYSYDRIDMRGASADAINPEWQRLAVGDIVPTHPEGGFRVAALEPERSLVLYVDSELIHEQAAAARARKAEAAAAPERAPAMPEATVGLKAVGAVSSAAIPEMAASWTFYLDPIDERRTRLLERFRVTMPDQPVSRLAGPAMDLGVFLMARKQLLGLKARAERGTAAGPVPAAFEPVPA